MFKRNRIALLLCLVLITIQLRAQQPGGTTRPLAAPVTAPSGYTNTKINYVRTWQPSMPTGDTAIVTSGSRKIAEVKEVTQYFDGLGRPLQTVSKQLSSAGNDQVAAFVYDDFGREQFKYLPYVPQSGNKADGKFKTDPFNAQQNFYQNGPLPDTKAESVYYNRIDMEPSPIGRVLKTYAPGNSWAKNDPLTTERGGNHPLEQRYQANTNTDSVRIWEMPATSLTPVNTGGKIYASGQLYKSILIDEAGKQSVEYKDKEGRLVLKKIQVSNSPGTAHMGWLCTYYVYDDQGNLRFVLSPKAVAAITANWIINTAVADGLCFIYRYDERNRMIMKKVPGADSTEMVYDVRDRMVFSRDGNLKSKSNWLSTFYDELNRPVMTAIYSAPWKSRSDLAVSMNTAIGNSTSLSYDFPGTTDLVMNSYDGKPMYEATSSITLVAPFETGISTETSLQINTAAKNGNTTFAAVNLLPNIPMSALSPLTYTYYDNYNFPGKQDYINSDVNKPQAGSNPYAETLPGAPSSAVNGMLTGTKVRVLGTDQWLTATVYYNDKRRKIQAITDNLSGGTDITTLLYDFNGKILSGYLRHRNQRSTLTPQITLLTMMHYDAAGRVDTVTKKLNDLDSLKRVIAVNNYNELGQLLQKRLGVTDIGQLETLNYNYNIRGWLTGINKDFVNTSNSTQNWFGQELSYDFGFSQSQFNGNIAGSKWKSGGDGIARAYGYSYDITNRLTLADFSQQNGSGWSKPAIDYTTSGLTYDENGNILFMQQKGQNGPLDDLKYGYISNTNKLLFVTDRANNPQSTLGDFKEINNNESPDYAYDNNGNQTQDLNRQLTVNHYNHLNLPDSIILSNKGYITYTYDANGNRLRKKVTDITGTGKITVTDYTGEFVYINDTLSLIGHEEGRIRTLVKAGAPVNYKYDYFVKDHLGNIRAVLTEQRDFSMYTATMEAVNAPVETALFSNVDETRVNKPVGYPQDENDSRNAFVAKLNAASGGKKIGPSLVLRVMTGDTVQINARAFYKSQKPVKSNTPPPVEDMLANLVQVFSGAAQQGTQHGQAAGNNNTPFNSNFYNNDYQRLKQHNNDQQLTNKPKAYLNFVLFDDQFKLVDQNSGVKQVTGEADQLQTLGTDKMTVKKSGFLYVYTSNESPQDVFFDDVVITQASGPLLEETHYYPFGLTIAGLSSNALKGSNYPENLMKYNGKELQHKEFADRSGLEQYDYGARMQDPQLGRFKQIDPKCEISSHVTPYNYCFNNPILFIDPDGMLAQYNWGDGKYYDEGQEVSWDETQKQYNIGQYAGNTSVMLAPEYEDASKKALKKDFGGVALKTIVEEAYKTGNIKVLHVSNADDAADQIEGITSLINNLFIVSHGNSKNRPFEAYFAIGEQNFQLKDIAGSSALDRIASKLASTPGPLPSAAQVLVFACGVGGKYNGGTDLLMALAKKLHATVFGNQSLSASRVGIFNGASLSFTQNTWPDKHDPAGLFSNSYNNAGNWTRAYMLGSSQANETVHSVTLDAFGKIHYEQ